MDDGRLGSRSTTGANNCRNAGMGQQNTNLRISGIDVATLKGGLHLHAKDAQKRAVKEALLREHCQIFHQKRFRRGPALDYREDGLFRPRKSPLVPGYAASFRDTITSMKYFRAFVHLVMTLYIL